MAESIPHSILAPFIQNYDTENNTIRVSINQAINDRLSKPEFTTNIFPEITPLKYNLHLIPTTVNESGKEATVDELIKKNFENKTWKEQVHKAMIEDGLEQDTTKWIDEPITTVNQNKFRDDMFTVRIDNLPEGTDKEILEKVLNNNGCDYFSKVVVPRDEQGALKRLGFIKFERLRYALKFLEDCPKIMVQSMILSTSLIA